MKKIEHGTPLQKILEECMSCHVQTEQSLCGIVVHGREHMLATYRCTTCGIQYQYLLESVSAEAMKERYFDHFGGGN